MADNWIFIAAFFFASILFLFHGIVLLIAPGKYLPIVQIGQPAKIELLRKRPLDLGKRFAGLGLTLLIGWFGTRPAALWMFHPKPFLSSWGVSPLSPGTPRWDLLIMGMFALGVGAVMMARPEKIVRTLFWADYKSLQDKMTKVLWTVYTQLFAVVFLLMSILMIGEFVKTM